MIVAHIAGVPFEEWLGPVIASSGGLVVAGRALLRRPRRGRRDQAAAETSDRSRSSARSLVRETCI